MHKRVLLVIGLSIILLIGAIWVVAQDTTTAGGDTCAAALEAIWTAASNACIAGPVGYICNGGSAPQAEPIGPISNALAPAGALVEVAAVDALHTAPIITEAGSGGVAWVRVGSPVRFTGLLVGDVTLRDATLPDFPPWQSTLVQTGPDIQTCGPVPHSVYVAQTPFGQPTNIAINGVSLGLNGTILVRTVGDQTLFAGLSGQVSLFAAGREQLLRNGEQSFVNYSGGNFTAPISPPSEPAALDQTLAQNLPVALLDRPVILPQPGYVVTDGAVNLRVAPSTDAAVILQAPAGQVLSVLGMSSSGQWYHVRLDSGETGWMLAELLIQNVGSIQAIYDSTPLPPQRYGELGHTGKVLAPAGSNLRSAPDASFPLVTTVPDGAKVTLLARSPYSPWVKVDFNGVVGWIALITLETQAFIEALPVDNNVPPPPTPTRIPGSFGNAFPDPNKDG
jgi:uncharacterized protein YgiM (DUF1202 family)